MLPKLHCYISLIQSKVTGVLCQFAQAGTQKVLFIFHTQSVKSKLHLETLRCNPYDPQMNNFARKPHVALFRFQAKWLRCRNLRPRRCILLTFSVHFVANATGEVFFFSFKFQSCRAPAQSIQLKFALSCRLRSSLFYFLSAVKCYSWHYFQIPIFLSLSLFFSRSFHS